MKEIETNYIEICKNNPSMAYNINPERFYKYVIENACSTFTKEELKEIINETIKED